MSTIAQQVSCKKHGASGPKIDYPPYPGELGMQIQQTICTACWQAWQGQQTILINEYRLNVMQAEAKQFLRQRMQEFLFHQQPATATCADGQQST